MKKLSYTLLIAILFVGLTGCGDDSTGPGTNEDPPQIPDLTEVAQPDISFFESNNPQEQKGRQILADEYSNYSLARFKAIFGTFFASFGQLYLEFLNPAYKQDAEFNDGVWEWSYSYSEEGQSFSMRLTSEELNSSIKWAMFISFDDGQGGGYDNYKVMEGASNKDGSKGMWTFNSLDQENSTEVLAATTKWNTKSDTDRTISTEMYDQGGSLSTTFSYEQNGVEHTMTFIDAETSDEDIVFWNTDTQAGYVIEDGTKMCWDENFQNISCS